MDLFKQKKIEKLEQENKEIKKLLVNLNKKLVKLEATSDEWDDYLKWKEMKDSLPDIDEMIEIKKLKELILQRNFIEKIIEKGKIGILEAQSKKAAAYHFIGENSKGYYQHMANDLAEMIKTSQVFSNGLTEQIDKILSSLKRNKKNNIIEMLKLYGLESDWILEKNE